MKTTERGGVRGFDAHKCIEGRKRHILVNTSGLPIASLVERTFAWPGRNRRLSTDYEYNVQTAETLIDLAAL